jgi:hypothetical protein
MQGSAPLYRDRTAWASQIVQPILKLAGEKPGESGCPAGEGKARPADRSGKVFHRQGIGRFFPMDFCYFPRSDLKKPFADKGFQRFPKFPQPLRLRFKFFLKRFLIRFSRWKKRLAASQALLHTDPACEKVTKLREGSKNQ